MHIPSTVRAHGAVAAVLVMGVSACSSAPPPARPVVPPITAQASPEPLTGKVVWHDLLTHDVEAAREFYGGLFGWKFNRPDPDSGRYWDIIRGNQVIGSVFDVDRAEVDSPLWLVSVSVSDVDAAVSQAGVHGATITVAPSDLPRRGRYAVVEDPQGAFLVLLRSAAGDPPDGQTVESGEWLWTELWTTDAADAVSFYEALLGYRPEGVASRLEEPAEGEYAEASAEGDSAVVFFAMYEGDRLRVGIHQLPGEARPYWLPYVAVRDVPGVAARAVELGGTVFLPPEAVRNGEAAILIDPTGVPFGIQQWPRPQGGDR